VWSSRPYNGRGNHYDVTSYPALAKARADRRLSVDGRRSTSRSLTLGLASDERRDADPSGFPSLFDVPRCGNRLSAVDSAPTNNSRDRRRWDPKRRVLEEPIAGKRRRARKGTSSSTKSRHTIVGVSRPRSHREAEDENVYLPLPIESNRGQLSARRGATQSGVSLARPRPEMGPVSRLDSAARIRDNQGVGAKRHVDGPMDGPATQIRTVHHVERRRGYPADPPAPTSPGYAARGLDAPQSSRFAPPRRRRSRMFADAQRERMLARAAVARPSRGRLVTPVMATTVGRQFKGVASGCVSR